MAQTAHTHGMRDYSMKCFNSLMFRFDWLLEVIHGYVWLYPGGKIIISVQGENIHDLQQFKLYTIIDSRV